MAEKDMKSVADFKREESLKYLRGMCFNNSAVLFAGSLNAGKLVVSVQEVFDFAEKLYDEAVKRDWVNYKGKSVPKELENPITEKEGREMDPELKKQEEIAV